MVEVPKQLLFKNNTDQLSSLNPNSNLKLTVAIIKADKMQTFDK